MTTPITTIADALIAFILSLLRDPAAVEEFIEAPEAVFANVGLQRASVAEVKAVAPVIIDHPTVIAKTGASMGSRPASDEPDEVVREIMRIVNQFTTIDNRSTIIDQSVNQNIWADGDVTQHFDQEAVVASGDHAIAVGGDATIDASETDVSVGDVSIGNTTIDGDVTGDVGSNVPGDADVDHATASDVAANAGDALTDAIDNATGAATDADGATTGAADSVESPADDLMTDMTATESYDSVDGAGAVVDEPYLEEPAEEQ